MDHSKTQTGDASSINVSQASGLLLERATRCLASNPKSEALNPRQIQSTNGEMLKPPRTGAFRALNHWDFEFASGFGFVLACSPPVNLRTWLSYHRSTAHPPGPGFRSYPPSAWIAILFQLPQSAMFKTSGVFSSQWRNFAAACQYPNGYCKRTCQPAGRVLSSRSGICRVS